MMCFGMPTQTARAQVAADHSAREPLFPSLGAGSGDRSCREVVSAVSRAGSFRIVIKASVNSRSENWLRIAVNHYSGALNSQISALFKWSGLDRMAVPNCIR